MFHLLHLLHYLIFVPRIVMMATYTQSTQTPITSATNNSMQTDTSTFNNSATQTRPFQSNQATQTIPQQNTQAIQTDFGLNENLTLVSTDSSTSTDVFDETVSINNFNSNRKRKSHRNHLSNKHSLTKQRKQVTFNQDQQNSSELWTTLFQCQKLDLCLKFMNNNFKLFNCLKLLKLWVQTVTNHWFNLPLIIMKISQ